MKGSSVLRFKLSPGGRNGVESDPRVTDWLTLEMSDSSCFVKRGCYAVMLL